MAEFYILGDMGSGSKDQYKVGDSMLQMINKHKHKHTFVCGLGDNIYENGVESVDDIQFIDKFEKPYEKIPDSIKFYMVLGNHDYGYDNDDRYKFQIEYGIQSQKKRKKWFMPDSYYTFKKNNVEFFIIDTNLDLMTKDQINTQLQTMIKLMKQSKARWKIVNGHHTWRSIAGHGNAEPLLETFLMDLFKEVHFDVYMCGHDHNKQLINLQIGNKKVLLVVCGTGGKMYDDNFNNYDNLDENSDLEFCSNNLGYGTCKATKQKLHFTFYNEHNDFEFNYDYSKK
jgi:tartrate-resistant acid phosphatase type 5